MRSSGYRRGYSPLPASRRGRRTASRYNGRLGGSPSSTPVETRLAGIVFRAGRSSAVAMAPILGAVLGCSSDTTEPSSQAPHLATAASSFLLVSDGLSATGSVRIAVTNANDRPLYVFRSCGSILFWLERETDLGWETTLEPPSCLALPEAEPVAAGASREFALSITVEPDYQVGTHRIVFDMLSWTADWARAVDEGRWPKTSRSSDEFELVIQTGGSRAASSTWPATTSGHALPRGYSGRGDGEE